MYQSCVRCEVPTVVSRGCSVLRALLFFRSQPQHHLFCTDSLSALHRQSGHYPDHPILAEILIQVSYLLESGKCCVFVGYPDTPAYLATRSPMRQPWTERCCLRDLSAVMFAPSCIAKFYPRGKTNGIIAKEENYVLLSQLRRRGNHTSVLSGRKKSRLTRFLFGHMHLRDEPEPVYRNCGAQLIVAHILVDCQSYSETRDIYHLHDTLSDLLRDDRFSVSYVRLL